MIPGNVDPRRAEKVQRYKPPHANGNAPVEDLTPDYMNILGPDSATANADGIEKSTSADQPQSQQLQLQQLPQEDIVGASPASATSSQSAGTVHEAVVQTSNGTNVIPTSPQYGVAIISNNTDVPNETTTSSTDTVIETTAKTNLANAGDDSKDMHSTPSRNDRFKVVKIASLEPFRRGRWKCMDYVDENPPPTTQQQSKQTQSATNIQQMSNMQYMQSQSLPQQHFQQMLVQGAFSGSPQGFYQSVPNPMMPQSQYFYPAQTTVNLQQVPVQPNSMQPTFINTNQQYFPANVAPHSAGGYTTYSNVQYVPSNLIQAQSSAFVPTSQTVPNAQLPANFQQSQTYAGQPSSAQQQQQQQQQPMVNGHAFPPNEQQPQQQQSQVASSLPTQIAKNVLLQQPAIVSTNPALINQTVSVAQNSINQQQPQYNPSYNPSSIPTNQSPQANISNITQVTQGGQGTQVAAVASTIITPVVPVGNQLPPSSQMNNPSGNAGNQPTLTTGSLATGLLPGHHQPINFNQMHITQMPIHATQSTHYELNIPSTNAVYTNPQFIACESNSNDGQGDGSISNVGDAGNNPDNLENASGEDPAKANPVVNAIDNKIEQAMDLVKSHLMYTVREEVEVLKEKIVELMERIQQLETENAYLKQQISKGISQAPSTNGTTSTTNSSTPDPTSQTPTQQPTTQQ